MKALSILLIVLGAGCERSVAAVLSISVEGPSGAPPVNTRSIRVDLDLGEHGRHVLTVQGDASMTLPKRVDITFREGQAGPGSADVSACDERTHQLLRSIQPVLVSAGHVSEITVELRPDAQNRCSDVGGHDAGAGGHGGGGGGGGGGAAGHGGGPGRDAGPGRDGPIAPADGGAPGADAATTCDPFLPNAAGPPCSAGQGCYLGASDEPACMPAGTGTLNTICNRINDCAPGFVCYRASGDPDYKCGQLCRALVAMGPGSCPPNPILPFPPELLCKPFMDSLYGACVQ